MAERTQSVAQTLSYMCVCFAMGVLLVFVSFLGKVVDSLYGFDYVGGSGLGVAVFLVSIFCII